MNLVAGIKEILASRIQFGTVGREGLVAAIEGIELLQHKKPTLTLWEIRHQGVETFQYTAGTIGRQRHETVSSQQGQVKTGSIVAGSKHAQGEKQTEEEERIGFHREKKE
ncbi:hypothetical protein [Mediterranea massiliensis]|uniref:hypothetical protein n=1 Tax=Mediterranea massiliensis TaxID=1841865 RepID=UPI0025A3A55D|nr:hypothetical protein [Mediterranea massiliensis]MDM8336671.1 hypothetical protein [Mediterranea massiliensis]